MTCALGQMLNESRVRRMPGQVIMKQPGKLKCNVSRHAKLCSVVVAAPAPAATVQVQQK